MLPLIIRYSYFGSYVTLLSSFRHNFPLRDNLPKSCRILQTGNTGLVIASNDLAITTLREQKLQCLPPRSYFWKWRDQPQFSVWNEKLASIVWHFERVHGTRLMAPPLELVLPKYSDSISQNTITSEEWRGAKVGLLVFLASFRISLLFPSSLPPSLFLHRHATTIVCF